jgi:hypothetical protein
MTPETGNRVTAPGAPAGGWAARLSRVVKELRRDARAERDGSDVGRAIGRELDALADDVNAFARAVEGVTPEDGALLRVFANVVCPRVAEVLVPAGASAEGWEDAARRFRALADLSDVLAGVPKGAAGSQP